jgi:threonyl-tRNA synthetase
MKVLQLHCSDFDYKIISDTPVAERPAIPKESKLKNLLACFTCFEKKDENKADEILDAYVKNIKIDTERIGCKTVLIYPYAHLSQELGSPRKAKKFLNRLRDRLKLEGFDVYKSPFGWYKSFRLTCKGHPLAEAYREY